MIATLGSPAYFLLSVLPLVLNPNTGDRNAKLMGFVVAALVLSAVLIVAYLVSSKKKKKK